MQIIGDPFVNGLEGIAIRQGGIDIVGVTFDGFLVLARVPGSPGGVGHFDLEHEFDAIGMHDAAIDPDIHFSLLGRDHAHDPPHTAPSQRFSKDFRQVVRFRAPHAGGRNALVGIEIVDPGIKYIDADV